MLLVMMVVKVVICGLVVPLSFLCARRDKSHLDRRGATSRLSNDGLSRRNPVRSQNLLVLAPIVVWSQLAAFSAG